MIKTPWKHPKWEILILLNLDASSFLYERFVPFVSVASQWIENPISTPPFPKKKKKKEKTLHKIFMMIEIYTKPLKWPKYLKNFYYYWNFLNHHLQNIEMMKIVVLPNIQITMICLEIMGKRLQKFKIFSKTTFK